MIDWAGFSLGDGAGLTDIEGYASAAAGDWVDSVQKYDGSHIM